MNISKDLHNLFFCWLERLERERFKVSSPPAPLTSGSGSINRHDGVGGSSFKDEDELFGILRFYEWSNINSTPKCFYTMKCFKEFLSSSGIHLKSYQLELLRNIPSPYVICKEGSKEILIRPTYDSLKSCLCGINKDNKGDKDKDKGDNSIHYNGQFIKAPLVFDESYNRMNEVSSWFG